MPFTTNDLASIDAVLASAEQSWRYGERGVTYQGTEALLKVRQLMLDDIAAANPTASRRRITRVSQGGRGY